MKKMLSKSLSYYLAVLSAIFCFGGLAVQAQLQFAANLSSGQELPPVNSNARGNCNIHSTPIAGSPGQFQLIVSCRYAGLQTAWTGFEISSGAVGENGSPIISLTGGAGPMTGDFSNPKIVDQAVINQMLTNRLYVNIKTRGYPNGEIRGQLHIANSAYNDFDGDGRTDITVYRTSNRTFYTQSSLNGVLTEKQIGNAGDSVSLTVDFDGDAKSDFSTAGYNGTFIWRVFQSATNAVKETEFGSSVFGDFFAAGDYDGDGKFDIAVFRGGVWYIIESSTGNYRTEFFGASGDVPAPNDFDKDGKADLAVARSENGVRVWYIRRSSDNQNLRVDWGLSSDAFFTGRSDFDGDGAADISVIRNESGQRTFYIRRSSDNQLQIIRWGASNDVVKLGDYDGDGKTDAAVTRAVNGGRVFFILQSSNNQPRYEYFGLAGDF